MSILIKGMKIPDKCGHCRFATTFECQVTKNFITTFNVRQIDCPLIPIPDHGDLIDRHKLYDKTEEWEAQALHMVEVHMNDEDTTEWRKWSTVLTERSAFKFDVADAPTVIPSEYLEEE